MPNETNRFCSSCGAAIAPGEKFCRNCGFAVPQPQQNTPPAPQQYSQPQQYIPPVPQQYSQPQQYSSPAQPPQQVQYSQPQYQPVPAYAGAPGFAQPVVRVKKKKPHGCLVSIIALLLVAVFIYTGFFYPAFVPRIIRHFTPMPEYCNGYSDSAKVAEGAKTKVGNIDESGIELDVSNGAFENGTNVSLDVLPRSDISKYEQEGYEILGSVVNVNADNYDGKFFAEDVILKIKLPVSQIDWSSNNGDYFAAYFDELKNSWRYVEPDNIDIKNGIAQLKLTVLETGKAIASKTTADERSSGLRRMTAAANGEMIFRRVDNTKKGRASLAFVKPDEKKKVEKYLQDWCTEKARQDTLAEEGKEAFQPYVNALAQKMAATKEAQNALAEALLGKLISGIDTNNTTGKIVSGSLDFTNTVGWGAYRALNSGDSSEFENALGTASAKALASTLTDNGTYVNYVGAAGSLGTIAGQISGGDYVGAVQTAEDAALGFFPTANAIDKAAKYVVRKVDMDYTMWKKDRIDDLYVKWRDGFETHPGYIFSIEYKARDFDDLMMYLDYDTHASKSGFGNADMMLKRIYDSDQKIDEQVKRYGFGSRTYKSLTEEEKAQFAKRVTNGLKEYFEQRYKNESRSEKLLSKETDFINELVEYGFFDSSRKTKVFHDGNDYNTEGRLDMIYKIRQMIGRWVDPAKQKRGSYSDFYLVSQYADFREDSNSVMEAKQKMLRWLKENKLLKDGIEISEDDKVTVDDIAGTWNMSVSFTNIESLAIDWLAQFFKTIVDTFAEDSGDADAEIESFKETFKNGVNDVTQIMTITKISSDRVKLELTTPDSETTAVYEGKLDDKGVLSVTLKSSTYSDSAISFDVKDIQYRFYKHNGYVTVEGTYDIKTIVFSATYTYSGEKNIPRKNSNAQ